MKEKLKQIQKTIVAGIILFIPVFVLIAVLERIFGFLSGFGKGIASSLGIQSIGGISAAPVFTTILLLVIFYLSGLSVRFAFITFRERIKV